ncbi:hypothetical protein V6N13_047527 [Hibiscus sabdariffa]
MMAHEGEWAWQHFEHLLPLDVLLRIAATKGPCSRVGRDWIGWVGSNDRRFSVKSGFSLRQGTLMDEASKLWLQRNTRVFDSPRTGHSSTLERSKHAVDVHIAAAEGLRLLSPTRRG